MIQDSIEFMNSDENDHEDTDWFSIFQSVYYNKENHLLNIDKVAVVAKTDTFDVWHFSAASYTQKIPHLSYQNVTIDEGLY